MSNGVIPRLIAKTRELNVPLSTLTDETNPQIFDTKFAEIESGLREWETLMNEAMQTEQHPEITQSIRELVENVLKLVINTRKRLAESSAAAAGGKRWKMPRLMSRKYCKKTPCKKMGFTQRSSCRPYKNCFTRRRKETF